MFPQTASFQCYMRTLGRLRNKMSTFQRTGGALSACCSANSVALCSTVNSACSARGKFCKIQRWLHLLDTNTDVMWIKRLMSVHSLHCEECRAGHVQCKADVTSQQLGQSDDRQPGSPDINLLSPDLQQQWDIERNSHLSAVKVMPPSGIKAVWNCNKCPAGQPHIWTATVQVRTRGSQCPYCSNRLACMHNSLATVAPDAAQYWNHSKNEKAPEQVVAGSNSKAEWKCPACNWEWQAQIKGRVRRSSGCPKCIQRSKGYQLQPTFVEAQPACLAEWDYEHNDAKGVYPDNTTLGSGKPVHWICSCCPRGQPHRWTASPNNRVGNGTGCPACAGKQACVCNSLESLFPLIAAEFDVDQNGFAPSDITAHSTKEVWWRNGKRGSWKQTVDERTDMRNQIYSQQVWLCYPLEASVCHQHYNWQCSVGLLHSCPLTLKCAVSCLPVLCCVLMQWLHIPAVSVSLLLT